jgi:hypothetical protein
LAHSGLQHLADGPADGFHGVGAAANTLTKGIDARLPILFHGARAQPRTIFSARDFWHHRLPVLSRIGAAAFRAINVLSHNLHLSVTGHARGREQLFHREI